MREVKRPIPGKFYVLGGDHPDYLHHSLGYIPSAIPIYSEKVNPGRGRGDHGKIDPYRNTLAECCEGEFVIFLESGIDIFYHKVGYRDLFGLVRASEVIFYELVEE